MEEILNNNISIKNLTVPDEVKLLPYGTTGYRMRYEIMDGVSYRMGILAAFRSVYLKKNVGLMITASHNPECDNGIKVIDPDGEMLPESWEKIAMEVVQWEDDQFHKRLLAKTFELGIEFGGEYKGNVLIGCDTRRSSLHISNLVILALSAVGSASMFFEFVTTPQLHFFVKLSNEKPIKDCALFSEIYFSRLSGAFCKNKIAKSDRTILNIDCANGVGAPQLMKMRPLISDQLDIVFYNTSTENLNLNCGADYVKINQSTPTIHNGNEGTLGAENRWCTIDGDADRLIYFHTSATKGFQLLDGDRIAVLIADFISVLLRKELDGGRFTMAIVQTAYANAASTQYIERVLKIDTKCVPTGVKHLHKAAKEFDIGIYFEANGHGTVLFSDKVRHFATTLPDDDELRRLIDLVNEADGDAISDILVIEHILAAREMTLAQWSAIYEDFPSRQLKVAVRDRNTIVTMDAERKVQSPAALQTAIDDAVRAQLESGLGHSRAFVRPSGTEDIVRVYCESSTQASADALAATIGAAVSSLL